MSKGAVTAPLADFVCKVVGGGTPSRSVPSNWSGPIPWASVKDLSDGELDLNETAESISLRALHGSAANLIPAGVPIVCTRMAVGRVVAASIDVAINQDLKALFPAADVDQRYLLHGITFLQPHLDAVATGSTVKGIRVEQLLAFPLLKPAPKEQRRIAEILDAMDSQIRSSEQIIEKLRSTENGMRDALLAPALNAAGVGPAPYSRVPAGWTSGPLNDFCTLQRGFDITQVEQRQGPYPVISSSGVTSFHDRFMVDGPGVITGRKGSLGSVYYCEGPFWPHDTSLWVKDFHGNDPKFIMFLLKSLRLERFDAATSVPTLNRNTIHPLWVAAPDEGEQQKIVSALEKLTLRVCAEEASLVKLRRLKLGLLNDLFTGRVRVPEWAAR